MAAVLAAAIYSRGGFSSCLSGSARHVMVTGGSTLHLEPGQYTLAGSLLVLDVFDAVWISCKLHYFRFVIDGGVMFSAVIPPV